VDPGSHATKVAMKSSSSGNAAAAADAVSAGKKRILSLSMAAPPVAKGSAVIPTEAKALFAFPVDWRTLDMYEVLEGDVRKWVNGQIIAYFGQEEQGLVAFVLRMLTNRKPASDIQAELTGAMGDDAKAFVVKLWTLLAELARGHRRQMRQQILTNNQPRPGSLLGNPALGFAGSVAAAAAAAAGGGAAAAIRVAAAISKLRR